MELLPARGDCTESRVQYVSVMDDDCQTIVASGTSLLTIDTSDQLAQPAYLTLDAGLRKDIVVLNPIQQFGQTPKCICFDGFQNMCWQQCDIEQFGSDSMYALRKTSKKGGFQVVDALHVPTGRMSDSPYIQNPLERSLRCLPLP